MSRQKILIVEDEPSLQEVLRYNLEREGYEVFAAADGQQGLQKARSQLPDLIVLDLMLPVLDGLEVCRRLRSESATVAIPILMLTAKSTELDEVVGFQMGADDYVTKPFRMKALQQRVKALLRRAAADINERDRICCGPLEIDRLQHRATINDRTLSLTPTEFRLLLALARQPGRAFNRAELMDAGMGEDAMAFERTIDVHIKSLRSKLDDHAPLIETVRGVGYRFSEQMPAATQQ